MKKVRDLLKTKGREVWSIGPDASVYEALQLMDKKGVGALMVMEGTMPVGLISERDYARKVILKGKYSGNTKIREIMSSPVVYGQLNQDIEDCMALMTDKRIRHLPIMHKGELYGMISIGDLIKSIIAEQRTTIEELERYITG